MDVIDRYLKERKGPDIHMMVLYTADIEKSQTALTRTACSIRVEASYLAGVCSEEWMEEVRRSIDENAVTDETRQYIKEVIGMTQVGKMLMDEADTNRAKRTARNMLKRGDTPEAIAEVLELPVETIKAWEQEIYAVM